VKSLARVNLHRSRYGFFRALQQKAALRRVNRLIDWELMGVFGYAGNRSLYGFQQEISRPANNFLVDEVPPTAFLLWAVSAGPMVMGHVLRTCQESGYALDVNRAVENNRESHIQGPIHLVSWLFYNNFWDGPWKFRSHCALSHFETLKILVKAGATFGHLPVGLPGQRENLVQNVARWPLPVWKWMKDHGFSWGTDRAGDGSLLRIALGWSRGFDDFKDKLDWLTHEGLNIHQPDKDGYTWFHRWSCELTPHSSISGSGERLDFMLSRSIRADALIEKSLRLKDPGEEEGLNAWYPLLGTVLASSRSFKILQTSEILQDAQKKILLWKADVLRQFGLDPNQRGVRGETALHLLAASWPHQGWPEWCLDYLVSWGLDFRAQTPDGKTPLDLVMRKYPGSPLVVQLQLIESSRQQEDLKRLLPESITSHVRKIHL
jgi:hypothetical protein